MKRTVFIFSALIVALLCLFQLSQYAYVSGDISVEFGIAVIAVVFFLIGSYLSKSSVSKRPPLDSKVEKNGGAAPGLTEREYEVLQEIALGLSNKEIGAKMFLSESTIKTHVSNLFIKLDAKRRTQAIRKAKEMQII
ncbi:response regulator transcription factor [Aggregatimonas sangjinii]|uniref:Response regulator transcription factor n=1 Tax=Aggregatimonas sangjinii TaxID=2583587 RepID=A0A5B7SW36_9FLAO|nr:response regulator transcription factor [Aggregatimonas sangjinii]QCX01393.1 response regulator transcription factor [Aggregatimonas sangjinii]